MTTTTTRDVAMLQGYLDAFEVLNNCANNVVKFQTVLLPPGECLAQSLARQATGHDRAGDVPASPALDQHPLEDEGRHMLSEWLVTMVHGRAYPWIRVGELETAWPRVSAAVEAVLGDANPVEDATEWLRGDVPWISERCVDRLLLLAAAVVGRPMQVSSLSGGTPAYWDRLFGDSGFWFTDPYLLEGPIGRLLFRVGWHD